MPETTLTVTPHALRPVPHPLSVPFAPPPTVRPGDIVDLALDPGQAAVVRAAAASGTPMVLVIATGRPRLLGGLEALPEVGAVLQV